MRLNLKLEKTVGSWFWRLMLGPAQLLDGVVSICSLTFVKSTFALDAARALSRSRLNELGLDQR